MQKGGRVNVELRAARVNAGMTQAQVAQEAGISPVVYQRYEYGVSEPGVRVALRIADILKANPQTLFGAATPKKE